MTGIPSCLSPLQLHNRLNQPVWIGFKLTRRGKRQLVFLSSGSEGGAQFSKNFATFVGQIVREFQLDPEHTDFVELRQPKASELQAEGDTSPAWYRWHAQWVGSAPMECKADPVTSETGRSYLEQALSESNAAA